MNQCQMCKITVKPFLRMTLHILEALKGVYAELYVCKGSARFVRAIP